MENGSEVYLRGIYLALSMAFYLELHKISPLGNEEIPESLHKNIVSPKVYFVRHIPAKNQGTTSELLHLQKLTLLNYYQITSVLAILASLRIFYLNTLLT